MFGAAIARMKPLEAGASGYVTKNEAPGSLLAAIREGFAEA
jgi:DNA-binding NarL/FixJ family response regulator